MVVLYVIAALALIGWMLSPASPWSGDLIEWRGQLVNRNDVRDGYGLIPPSRYQQHRTKVLQRRALRQSRRLSRVKRKIEQLPQPEKKRHGDVRYPKPDHYPFIRKPGES